MDNLVGIQSGFLTQADALDNNFIASQELNNEGFQLAHGTDSHGLTQTDGSNSFGLVQPTKYTSGSLILDDYRLPTQEEASRRGHGLSNGFSRISSNSDKYDDNSGQYVHDPSGDHADPYKHIDSPAVPYVHDDSKYKQAAEFYDYGRYSASQSGSKYEDNSGQYIHDHSGAYVDFGSSSYSGASGYSGSTGYPGSSGSSGNTGSSGYYDSTANSGYFGYTPDYSGSYKQDNSGQYIAGVYRQEDHIRNFGNVGNIETYNGGYSSGNAGQYLSDSKAYTGASHTLTAGAINVGLVGKTTLVDAGYTDQFNYGTNKGSQHSYSHQTLHNAHLPIISQPAVSINHVGTDQNNLDGYSFVTTPTTSGIPTTETPFAVTTAIPTTIYKTTHVPVPQKTSIKQIFGYTQPDVTYVQPTVTAVTVAPKIQITDYTQGVNVNIKSESSGYEYSKPFSGYNYPKPNIKFEEGISYTTPAPQIVVSTFKPQGFSHNQQTVHNVETSNAYIPPALESGYYYPNPVPVTEEPFKKVVAYTTGTSKNYVQPTAQSFNQQTIHKIETNHAYLPPAKIAYEYKPEVTYEQPKTVVEYTTAQPVTVQPVVSYQPQVISHQTLHKVDGSKVNTYSGVDYGYKYEKPSSGYDYPKPEIKFEEAQKTVIQYTTPAPAIPTYKPHSYSQQTFHKYASPTFVSTTPAPQVELTYHQPAVTVYENPILKYKAASVSPAVYVQPTAQSYGQQIVHTLDSKAQANNAYLPPVHTYEYKPPVTYEQPKTVVEYTTAQPAVSTSYSHQTLHKVESAKVDTSNTYLPPANTYEYKSEIAFEHPKTVVEYTTAQPAIVSTYQPQVYSHQTFHKVEANKVNTYQTSEDLGYTYEKPASGYEYHKPAVQFEETPKIIQHTTPAPAPSTHRQHSYSSQTIHKVETPEAVSTVAPKVYQPAVTVYENPILKYIENVTPSHVYTQTYKPAVQQHEVNYFDSQPAQYESSQQNLQFNQEGYSYNQPEIQREAELNVAKAYSDASLVSHQTYHLYDEKRQQNSGKDVVFVSSTPSTLIYEDHYAEYESPKKIQTYKAPEYIPPKVEYEQTYTVPSTAAPEIQQSSVFHQIQDQYDYKPNEYSQQYNTASVQQVAFSTSHIDQPKKIESVQFSSFPDTKVTNYKQVSQVAYESPEIQVGYKAEEYLPPVVSTSVPVVTTTYKPRTYTYSTTKEYLPPTQTPQPTIKYLPPQSDYNAPEYLPPKVDNTYLPPSTTTRPIVKSTTHIPPTIFKAREYLPPQEPITTYESFKISDESSKIQYNPYQEYTVSTTAVPIARKQNIVVDTAKSNLLGFGTVGPDAGLVSPVTYTTTAPVISSTYEPYSYEITRTPLPTRKNKPRYKSTTPTPVEHTTAYKAPEYLPPVDENVKFDSYGLKNFENNAYQEEYLESTTASKRKQNIVVETAKSQLLGFGTVGPDAGLISEVTYTSAAPTISSTDAYSATPKIVTSTYAPVKQQLIEVSSIPVRRTKPKVAVVTKINDFNPLLVRKLGAVCSCQSPIVVLRGRRPNVQVQQDFDEYGNDDYSDADGLGDNNNEWAQKSVRLQTVKTVTVPSVTKTTFNPIIVPDDSFYQDYQESVEITPKAQEVYSENYVSSTPVAVTERVVKIRPRVKAVTVAPTYKTVLLGQEVAPVLKATATRRDDLQGIKCERAGLFRHPKQCNKFYACRWDCNKQKFTLHTFNCPVQLSFDPSIGACNWPSQGPACQGDTLLTNTL